MSFFRKLFGSKSKQTPPPVAPPAAPSATEEEPIRVFDKFGRELLIPRREWVKVLHHNLRKDWDQPDELAGQIIQSLGDGLAVEVEEAAKQLHEIDTIPSRGACLLAIVFLQTGRPLEAEKLLSAHLAKHGENGEVLTNLAKAQEALGRDAESLATLWRALEVDPNQDNGLAWYVAIHREKDGEAASIEAYRRVSAVPGSWLARLWLARLWLARDELVHSRLDPALALYREAIDRAPKPIPAELLMQLSGDLGNHGHLMPLLDLTGPHFDVALHGLQVGNNLIKASIDTGQLDQARAILDQLQAQQRPDWKETLGYWEGELHKARLSLEEKPTYEQLRLSLLTIPGALWLPADHPVTARFPKKAEDAPHVVVSGCTFERPQQEDKVRVGPSDMPGRYSRALPLVFSEHLSLHSSARVTTIIPWILNGHGGFGVFGQSPGDDSLVEQAQRAIGTSGHPADYVLDSHLLVRGENVTLRVRLIRCIDGRRLSEFSSDFPEGAFHRAAGLVLEKLGKAFAAETDISFSSSAPTIAGPELDHYLFRLEQALAVGCSTMEKKNAAFLANPAEILDGMLHLCLQNPEHLPSRMLLLRTLRKLREHQRALVAAMRPKVEALLAEHPIASVQQHLENDLRELM